MISSSNKRSSRWILWLCFLVALALGSAVVALIVGPAGIPFEKILRVLGGEGGIENKIVWDIRFPRLLLGFAIGGALSLAGVILQGLFRNPLVEPYTLGISGGAAVGVSLNILLGFSRAGMLSLTVSGFLGACLIIVFLYFLSAREKTLSLQRMLLTGVMLTFVASSSIMLILALSRTENLQEILFWIMGSLSEPNRSLIYAALILSVLSLFVSYLFHSHLNAFALGEEEAAHLGIPVERTKRILLVMASLLTGVSVAVAGVIGFVGLVVPHIMRKLVGRDHRILLVTSFLGGGSFLVLSDSAARTLIAPLELPVGVITGIIGGILFITVLMRSEKGAL